MICNGKRLNLYVPQVWDFYRDLKVYKAAPDAAQILTFEARFDEIFTQRTQYATLNELLKRTHQRKEELLLVLRRPEIPLHTNGSENDIRCYVQKQKISGGTRSELGRKMPRHLHQFEENLPKIRHVVLAIPARSTHAEK